MAKTLRLAMAAALGRSGHSLQSVAHGTGIASRELERIISGISESLDLRDAQKVADFFGVPLSEFLEAPELKGPLEIADLYNQLPEHLKAQFRAYQPAPIESSDPFDPESL